MSDCGGLTSSLMALLGIFSKILMFRLLDFYMVKKLYTRTELEGSIRRDTD